MFSSNIGRLRFFFYSVAVLVAEIVATILCIAGTMGISGLADSRPGPSREGLALAVLIASVVLVVVRSNFAWRRSRDANGAKWILWVYIVFSAIFALLQAGTLLVYDFNGDDSNLGLNMLGLAIFGLWCNILFARPTGGSRDPGAYSEIDDPGPAPRSARTFDAPAIAQARPSSAAPAPAAARGAPVRRPGFGKRGLA